MVDKNEINIRHYLISLKLSDAVIKKLTMVTMKVRIRNTESVYQVYEKPYH